MMKLAVIGSRSFNDYELMKSSINDLAKKQNAIISTIVSGGAMGADKLGEKYANEYDIPTEIYLPDWSKGKYAGLDRNHQIIINSDIVICFWDGKSRGTLHSINLSKKYNKECIIINF